MSEVLTARPGSGRKLIDELLRTNIVEGDVNRVIIDAQVDKPVHYYVETVDGVSLDDGTIEALRTDPDFVPIEGAP